MQQHKILGASRLRTLQPARCIITLCAILAGLVTVHCKRPNMQVSAQQHAPRHHGRGRAARGWAHSLAAAKSCAFAARQCSGVTPAVSASASRSASASAQRAWCRTAGLAVGRALVAPRRLYSACAAKELEQGVGSHCCAALSMACA